MSTVPIFAQLLVIMQTGIQAEDVLLSLKLRCDFSCTHLYRMMWCWKTQRENPQFNNNFDILGCSVDQKESKLKYHFYKFDGRKDAIYAHHYISLDFKGPTKPAENKSSGWHRGDEALNQACSSLIKNHTFFAMNVFNLNFFLIEKEKTEDEIQKLRICSNVSDTHINITKIDVETLDPFPSCNNVIPPSKLCYQAAKNVPTTAKTNASQVDQATTDPRHDTGNTKIRKIPGKTSNNRTTPAPGRESNKATPSMATGKQDNTTNAVDEANKPTPEEKPTTKEKHTTTDQSKEIPEPTKAGPTGTLRRDNTTKPEDQDTKKGKGSTKSDNDQTAVHLTSEKGNIKINDVTASSDMGPARPIASGTTHMGRSMHLTSVAQNLNAGKNPEAPAPVTPEPPPNYSGLIITMIIIMVVFCVLIVSMVGVVIYLLMQRKKDRATLKALKGAGPPGYPQTPMATPIPGTEVFPFKAPAPAPNDGNGPQNLAGQPQPAPNLLGTNFTPHTGTVTTDLPTVQSNTATGPFQTGGTPTPTPEPSSGHLPGTQPTASQVSKAPPNTSILKKASNAGASGREPTSTTAPTQGE